MKGFRVMAYRIYNGSSRNDVTYRSLAEAKRALRAEMGWTRVYSVFIESEGRYLCYPTQAARRENNNDDGAYTPSILQER